MARVLKWGIPFGPAVHVPFDGQVLPGAEHVGDHVVIWSLEPAGGIGRTRTLKVFGTGWEVPDGWEWRATAPRTEGFVWHVFEKTG